MGAHAVKLRRAAVWPLARGAALSEPVLPDVHLAGTVRCHDHGAVCRREQRNDIQRRRRPRRRGPPSRARDHRGADRGRCGRGDRRHLPHFTPV